MSDKVLGWHFTDGMKLRDGEPLMVGRTYRLPAGAQVVMCEVGYHASKRLIDALQYAPGSMLSRVELGGTVLRSDDKCCGSERTVLWTLDCERILHEAACVFAERALEREREAGREPDARSWAAIAVKRRWMAGESTDAELAAARAAVGAAARAAVWASAREAVWASAWTTQAAREAARASARKAARALAREAVWAAREAARAARKAVGAAAWTTWAAREAARASEMAWQEDYLVRMVTKVHEEEER